MESLSGRLGYNSTCMYATSKVWRASIYKLGVVEVEASAEKATTAVAGSSELSFLTKESLVPLRFAGEFAVQQS